MKGYVIGSAADPDENRRKERSEIELVLRTHLMDAGVPRDPASETVSALVVNYLETGSSLSLAVIRKLDLPTATRLDEFRLANLSKSERRRRLEQEYLGIGAPDDNLVRYADQQGPPLTDGPHGDTF